MNRNELTLAVAGALAAAVLLGWILRWFFARMNGSGPRNAARTAQMAELLHAAEAAKVTEQARRIEVEAEAGRRVAELQAELASARDDVARAEAQTEEIRAAYRKALIDRGGPDAAS